MVRSQIINKKLSRRGEFFIWVKTKLKIQQPEI